MRIQFQFDEEKLNNEVIKQPVNTVPEDLISIIQINLHDSASDYGGGFSLLIVLPMLYSYTNDYCWWSARTTYFMIVYQDSTEELLGIYNSKTGIKFTSWGIGKERWNKPP